MWNLRTPRRSLSLLVLSTAVLVAVASGSPSVAGADSVGTLDVSGTLMISFSRTPCPAGTPETTNCYREAGGGTVRGLGGTAEAYTLFFDDFGLACGHVHAQIPIVVAGKGEIDLATSSTGCISPDALTIFPPSDLTVTGGSGRYAGASGSGVLTYRNYEVGGGTGSHVITWTGVLNVADLTFDTSPPQIGGAISKTVTARLAAGVRVRYAATAVDAIDGSVRAACRPASGSRFQVGRTIVRCAAGDTSGNGATARFVITVKRTRH